MNSVVVRKFVLILVKGCIFYVLGSIFALIIDSQWGIYVLDYFSNLNKVLKNKVSYYLLSPVYELVLGITLGVNDFKNIPRFNDVSMELGLIHVLVVSGYNINLVINLVFKFLSSKYNKLSLFTALFIALIYALIVGLEAPVIRAYVMSSIFLVSSSMGRYRNPLVVLLFSIFFVLGLDVRLLDTLSMQLSYLASFGLIFIYQKIQYVLEKRIDFIPQLFITDLSATLSAQLFTAPLIFYHFKRYSLISILSNMLLLFFIPILTTISIPLFLVMYINDFVSNILSYVLTQISLLFFICSDILVFSFSKI